MRKTAARHAAFVLLAAGAWLAAVRPAAGQRNGTEARSLLNGEEIRRQTAATYPPALQARGIAGLVVLRFRILADGSVDSASVSAVEATDTGFVEPAKAVGRRMTFTPARTGAPEGWHTFNIRFVPTRQAAARDDACPGQPSGFSGLGRTAPPDEGTYELSAVERPPRMLNVDEIGRQITANYPAALVDSGVTGQVDLRFRILENGTVDPESVMVEEATNPAFADAATRVTGKMRFSPAFLRGCPVKVWVTLPIYFNIMKPLPAEGDSAGRGTRGGTARP
ncbi:MAG TPA: TonB family protein [Longimicrobium sp.]|nr:TonB family protein [Longimicrobium sp.]